MMVFKRMIYKKKGAVDLKKKMGLVIVGFVCMALLFGCNSQVPATDIADDAALIHAEHVEASSVERTNDEVQRDASGDEENLAEPANSATQLDVEIVEEVFAEQINFANLFDVALGDEYFMKTVNDVFADFNNYVGKSVRLEGVFEYFGMDTIYRQVFRRAGTC